ncbi:MAG: glycosyltransferase [Acidobacteria bacterium]|nr:glycosyltransferase [Candidatus Atribacteria bacterium]MBE3125912.1 glycosyltransferase [Acidobacteriota bacterium]
MSKIRDYVPIVGESTIEELFLLAERLKGKIIQNINSTAVGGGVAEILIRMLPLLQDLGVNASWGVIKGDEKFFHITKKMHNALHGVDASIGRDELDYFIDVNRQNTQEIMADADILFIHDPQPIALVEQKDTLGRKWIWRCHIDFTNPKKDVWDFLKNYIERFDCAVFSAPAFSRPLAIRQVLISPSIDPLSEKNRELSDDLVNGICERFNIDRGRPVITQISRFDYLKDPVGVIRAYKMVKKHLDCQLVLAGGGATDDPEGMKVLEEVHREAENDPDIFVLFLPPGSDIEINALQRASDIVLQKSLREGFGLTVAEGLWKGKPVIASAVGGIPLQIAHKYSGILTHSIEGTAYWIKQLLNEPEYAAKLGVNGREHIKYNYLITRHIRDYLLLFLSLYEQKDIVSL